MPVGRTVFLTQGEPEPFRVYDKLQRPTIENGGLLMRIDVADVLQDLDYVFQMFSAAYEFPRPIPIRGRRDAYSDGTIELQDGIWDEIRAHPIPAS